MRLGIPLIGALTTALNTIDATNEAIIMAGQVFTEDGGSHAINTTGSSALGWRSAGVTFANGGTVAKVGLADLDLSAGPPGRAAHASNVISFDVSADFTGGAGGITANAWQESVPTTGAKTVANGDFLAFAVQLTARAGADSVVVACGAPGSNPAMPYVTAFQSSSYTLLAQVPNAVITFSDGVRGYFYGGYVASTHTNQGWNNGSATKEYGNLIRLPFPAKAYGLIARGAFSGDTDLVLYSDPLGTPAAEKTVSVDLNIVGTASDAPICVMFPSPFTLNANTPYGAIFKPTSVTSITAQYKTYGNAAHQTSESGGDGYAINRASGAFAQQNSGLDRFGIGLLIGAGDSGGSAGRSIQINNDSLVA